MRQKSTKLSSVFTDEDGDADFIDTLEYTPMHSVLCHNFQLEQILQGNLDSIPSPSSSAKIQIMGGKVFLKCKAKTLLVIVNKLSKTKSLLTSPSNVLPYYLK